MAKKESDTALSLAEALNYAKGMKNAYRAFEKLEQIILFVAQAEQQIAEAHQQKTAIEEQIANLNAVYATKDAECAAHHQDTLRQYEAETEQRRRDLDAFQQAITELQSARDQAQTELIKLQDACTATRKQQALIEQAIAKATADEHQRQAREKAEWDQRRRAAEETHTEQMRALAQDEEDAHARLQALHTEEHTLRQRIESLKQTVEQFRQQTARLTG